MYRFSIGLAVLIVVAACSNPITQTRTVDTRPSIVIKNAALGSTLFVDDLRIGSATDYETKALILEPGTHVVKVVGVDGQSYSEKIFVSGSATKTLTVVPGIQK